MAESSAPCFTVRHLPALIPCRQCKKNWLAHQCLTCDDWSGRSILCSSGFECAAPCVQQLTARHGNSCFNTCARFAAHMSSGKVVKHRHCFQCASHCMTTSHWPGAGSLCEGDEMTEMHGWSTTGDSQVQTHGARPMSTAGCVIERAAHNTTTASTRPYVSMQETYWRLICACPWLARACT